MGQLSNTVRQQEGQITNLRQEIAGLRRNAISSCWRPCQPRIYLSYFDKRIIYSHDHDHVEPANFYFQQSLSTVENPTVIAHGQAFAAPVVMTYEKKVAAEEKSMDHQKRRVKECVANWVADTGSNP